MFVVCNLNKWVEIRLLCSILVKYFSHEVVLSYEVLYFFVISNFILLIIYFSKKIQVMSTYNLFTFIEMCWILNELM